MFKELGEKISSYQLFNFFYPGAVFLFIIGYTHFTEMQKLPIGYFLLLSYFVGMILSRIGSLLIEDILKWMNCIKKYNYDLLVQAELKDTKVNILLEVCNTYRTVASLFLVLFFYFLLSVWFKWEIRDIGILICIDFLCIFLFILSFIKQYNYVRKRVIYLNRGDGKANKLS